MQSFEEEEKNELRESRSSQRMEHQRMRKLRRRLFLGVLAVIVVLSAVLIIRGCRKKPQEQPEPVLPTADAPQSDEADVPAQDIAIRIAAVGDIMISDAQLEAAKQENGGYDFSACFSPVSAYMMAPDLTVGNLELNFCREPYAGKPDYRAPDELAEALSEIGFDVLQTANSYSIQNGISGLRSTISTLDAYGMDHLGTYASEEEKEQSGGVLVRNVNGVRIAFLGYTKGVNNLTLPKGEEYAVDLLYEDYAADYAKIAEDAILRSVEAARAYSPDLIVAMLHWGSEFDRGITASQEKIRDLLLENGVDVILGSHTHMAGKLEQRTVTGEDGEERNCFIAYSLGNFFADQTQPHTMQSMILYLNVTKNAATGKTTVTGAQYTPICTVKYGEDPQKFEVLPIRKAISSGLFDDQKQTLTDAIADLRTATESDLDSGT